MRFSAEMLLLQRVGITDESGNMIPEVNKVELDTMQFTKILTHTIPDLVENADQKLYDGMNTLFRVATTQTSLTAYILLPHPQLHL